MNNSFSSDLLPGIEPDFVLKERKISREAFEQLGFPDLHHEDWKYTPIKKFLPRNDSPQEIGQELNLDILKEINPFPGLDCITLVLENGRVRNDFSLENLPGEIMVIPIESALETEKFKIYFNELANKRVDAFTLLNSSDFDRGILIYLKKGVQFQKPIHIVHVHSGKNNIVQNSKNIIILEELSELTLLESYISLDTQKHIQTDLFSNDLTEYFIEKGAKLETLRFQSLGRETRLVNTQIVQVKKHGGFKSHTYSISGKLVRNNLQINLSDSESEAHLYGFYSIHDQELVDNHTLVKHLKPNCQSNELYKGVLEGKSIGVFNGRVEVSQDAQKTNAYQQNQTILLSPESSMNSKPELEIFADDVKCSHGSTLGQLDKGALFYLQSRGISEKTSKKLMINAFAHSLISEISNPEIAEEIGRKIQNLGS